jgi:hypothetical protein
VGQGWRTHDAPPFCVHHRNDFAARKIASAAEYHLDGISRFLGLTEQQRVWDIPLQIHVYRDRNELRGLVAGIGNQLGQTNIQAKGGAPSQIAIHVSQDAQLLLSSVLPHELAHVVLTQVARYRAIPPVLDEGLAMQFEPPALQERYDRIEPAQEHSGDLRALLSPDAPLPQSEAEYVRARQLADFLIERIGWPGVLRALRAEGEIGAELIQQEPWVDEAALEADWQAYFGQGRQTP